MLIMSTKLRSSKSAAMVPARTPGDDSGAGWRLEGGGDVAEPAEDQAVGGHGADHARERNSKDQSVNQRMFFPPPRHASYYVTQEGGRANMGSPTLTY